MDQTAANKDKSGVTVAGANQHGQNSALPKANINDVPRRPLLSYSIEQRRQIESGLVRDRELAQYASVNNQRPSVNPVVLQRPPGPIVKSITEQTPDGGRSDPPDQNPTNNETGALLAAVEQVEPAAFESGAVIESNNGGLNDFLEDLRRLFLDPFEEISNDGADGNQASTTDRSAAVADQDPVTQAVRPVEGAVPTASTKSKPDIGATLLELDLAADQHLLNDDQSKKIRATLDLYDLSERRLVAVGNAATPALAIERARETARILLAAGVPVGQIDIQSGSTGESVVLLSAAR